MVSIRFLRVPFLLVVLASALPLSAQTLRGRVVAAENGDPVASARVEALTARGGSVRGRTFSGADGSFVLTLRAAGSYRLRAGGLGYPGTTSQVLEVGPGDTVVVDVRVSSEPLRVDPVVVTARRRPPEVAALRDRGFYERKREGFGRFMERAEIERYRTSNMIDILDRIPGTMRIHNQIVFPRSSTAGIIGRTQRGGGGHCLPVYYLDGIEIRGGPTEAVIPEHVEAIEVYSSPSNIPARYNGSNAACGVVLIWTRAGP